MAIILIAEDEKSMQDIIVEYMKRGGHSCITADENAVITQKGKNWYIDIEDYQITVNAFSYTIITAHKVKR